MNSRDIPEVNKPTVKCMACGKIFTSVGALKHQNETGHKVFELLMENQKGGDKNG